VTGSHTPGLHLHPSYPGGVLVDLEPLSWGNYTDAVLVYYPSLLSRLVRVLPEEEQEQIIDTALAAWQVVR
jgi:hypothetical protein